MNKELVLSKVLKGWKPYQAMILLNSNKGCCDANDRRKTLTCDQSPVCHTKGQECLLQGFFSFGFFLPEQRLSPTTDLVFDIRSTHWIGRVLLPLPHSLEHCNYSIVIYFTFALLDMSPGSTSPPYTSIFSFLTVDRPLYCRFGRFLALC